MASVTFKMIHHSDPPDVANIQSYIKVLKVSSPDEVSNTKK